MMKSHFNKQSIRYRLMTGFGLLAFLLIVATAISWLTLNKVQSYAMRITALYEPQVDRMTKVELLMIKISLEARHAILASTANDKPELNATLDRILDNRQQLVNLIEQTENNLSTEKGRQIMFKIKQDDEVFWQIAQRVVGEAHAGNISKAYELLTTDVVPARNKQLDNIAEQKEWQRELMSQALADANDLISIAKTLLTFLVLGVFLILSILLIRLINSITRPLADLLNTIVRVEQQGNYSERVKVLGEDEVARTAHAFNCMMDWVESRNSELDNHREVLEETVKQRTAELKNLVIEAQAASQAKSDFLANMSHEIRTPMNGVIGMTELALEATNENERKEYLLIVKSSATSLLNIINDILDFSKIEANKLMLEQVGFSIRQLASETLKMLSVRANDKGLELICDISTEVPDSLIGDPTRLRQILINLIGNAIKFTHHGQIQLRIQLETQAEGMVCLTFSVIDSGIGIPSDKLDSIFESFAQVDASTTRQYGGTGLGLSISNSLVKLMGGQIRVNSKIGEGSTFSFTISLIMDNNPISSIDLSALQGKQVLVVDDNPINLKILVRYIKGWGMQPIALSSGKDVHNLFSQRIVNPDLILLDYNMPDMHGGELAEWLRQQPSLQTTPLLILSSGIPKENIEHLKSVAVTRILTKPLVDTELLDVILNSLGSTEHLPNAIPVALSEAQPSPPVKTLSILLVEDNVINQKLAIHLLEKWGHTISLAVNGQEAVDRLRSGERYDVVLMDMQMPVMGGIEATRLIRLHEEEQGKSRQLIIAMTANAMQGDKEQCLHAGMDDYLSKPINQYELKEKLNAIDGNAATLSIAP